MSGEYANNGHDPETRRTVQPSGNREAARRGLASRSQLAAEAFGKTEAETEAEAFKASVKEPRYVIVSSEMVAAGVERLDEMLSELRSDPEHLVQAIYMAMEYERRSN